MTCSMMHQIGYGFYWSIKKWSELRQKSFWFILWAFLFMSSCTLWVTLQDFAKWKTLRYIFVISFISIAFGGGEIKIFQTFLDWFSIHETLSWVFWALSPQNIVQFCWNFDQRWSPISVWKDSEKYFKILNLTQMEDTESLQFCSILGPNLLLENQKYC